jgi:hypothetical protein
MHHLLEFGFFPTGLIYLGFITEGKLVVVLIKPSLGVSNWPDIYIINYTPAKHQQVFWYHYGGLKKKLPHQYRAINKFSGAVAGEEEDFCKGSFVRTSFTLF